MFVAMVMDVFLVVYKNTLLDLKSPLQLAGEFLMPLQVCLIIYFVNCNQHLTQTRKTLSSPCSSPVFSRSTSGT